MKYKVELIEGFSYVIGSMRFIKGETYILSAKEIQLLPESCFRIEKIEEKTPEETIDSKKKKTKKKS